MAGGTRQWFPVTAREAAAQPARYCARIGTMSAVRPSAEAPPVRRLLARLGVADSTAVIDLGGTMGLNLYLVGRPTSTVRGRPPAR